MNPSFTVDGISIFRRPNFRNTRIMAGGGVASRVAGVYYQVSARNGDRYILRGSPEDIRGVDLQEPLHAMALRSLGVPENFQLRQDIIRRRDLEWATTLVNASDRNVQRTLKTIQRLQAPEAINFDELPFGYHPSRAMFFAALREGETWHESIHDVSDHMYPDSIIPFHRASGDYGSFYFDSYKAYRADDGAIVGWRWGENGWRLRESAMAASMPPIVEAVDGKLSRDGLDLFLRASKAVTLENFHLIPPADSDAALYIRARGIGWGGVMGVAPAVLQAFMIYVSPVGKYFPGGFAPIALLAEEKFHRAGRGGLGGWKIGGNYLLGQRLVIDAKAIPGARIKEILYLAADGSHTVEEAGAANFFAVKDGVLYTTSISDKAEERTILPGITRHSIIELAKAHGMSVNYDHGFRLSLEFVLESADEWFCTGTAAVVAPVGMIMWRGKKYHPKESAPGRYTTHFYEALRALQRCRWNHPSLKDSNALAELHLSPLTDRWMGKVQRDWITMIQPAP